MALVLDEELVKLKGNLTKIFILHKTVLMNKYKIVKYLLRQGYDPNRTSYPHQMTPLMMTCFLRDPDTSLRFAELLLANGADASRKDDRGYSVLSYAAANRLTGVINLILREIDFELGAQDGCGNTILHIAAMTGDSPTLQILLDRFCKYGVSVNVQNSLALTPLLLALLNSHTEAAVMLKESGGSPLLDDTKFTHLLYSLRNCMTLSSTERKLVVGLRGKTLARAVIDMFGCETRDSVKSKATTERQIHSATSSLRTAAKGKPTVFKNATSIKSSNPSLSFSLRFLKLPREDSAANRTTSSLSEPIKAPNDSVTTLRNKYDYQFTPSYRCTRYKAPIDDRWVSTIMSYAKPCIPATNPAPPPVGSPPVSARLQRQLKRGSSRTNMRGKMSAKRSASSLSVVQATVD